MTNICLCSMSRELCREYFDGFTNDPMVYENQEEYKPYVYDQDHCDRYWQRQKDLGRIHLAIMLGSQVIGEIILKNVDPVAMHCTLSIHLKNDTVKNKGYGTTAEILALDYSFEILKMKTVFADALRKNQRSHRVLAKAGFAKIHEDDTFIYYKCDKASWCRLNH